MARKKEKKERFEKKVASLPSPASPAEPGVGPDRVRRTDEEIKKDKIKETQRILTDRPDPMLVPLVRMVFNAWPNGLIASIRYEDLAKMAEKSLPMNEDEAVAIATPLTQLKNYYLPNINPIWLAWTNLASAIYNTMAVRLRIIRELKSLIALREKDRPKETKPAEQAEPKDPNLCNCKNPNIPLENGLCSICKKKRLPKK